MLCLLSKVIVEPFASAGSTNVPASVNASGTTSAAASSLLLKHPVSATSATTDESVKYRYGALLQAITVVTSSTSFTAMPAELLAASVDKAAVANPISS